MPDAAVRSSELDTEGADLLVNEPSSAGVVNEPSSADGAPVSRRAARSSARKSWDLRCGVASGVRGEVKQRILCRIRRNRMDDGMGWAGLDWTGPGWTGLGWAGLGWAGPGWAGLGGDGMGWTGIEGWRLAEMH